MSASAGAALGALVAVALAAAPDRILVPPWPLARDGERVAVRGAAPLRADGARVVALGGGLHEVIPDPAARVVALEAGAARVEVPVEPGPGRVELALEPPEPVKGRDAALVVTLVVKDASGAIDATSPPPRLAVSGAALRELAPAGPGRFTGRLELAAGRMPELALVVAVVPRCPTCRHVRAAGRLAAPIAAAIDLPGRAEPGVATTVEVGGRSFGPAVADRHGRFTVGLVVPPGARTATAIAVDRLGNRSRTSLDLGLPPVDGLACTLVPPVAPADGEVGAGIWCAAAEPAGPPPAARAQRGGAGRFEPVGAGLWWAEYRAPRGGAAAPDVVEVTRGEGRRTERERLEVPLAAGAPAAIEVALEREPVPLGATVAADAWARDARGDRLGPAEPARAGEGGFATPGRFTARRAPDGWVQREPLVYAAPAAREVARVALRREGREWVAEARSVDGRPVPGAALRFGSGARAVTDARGRASVGAGGDEETVEAEGGARAAGWAGVEPPPWPAEVRATVEVRLRPPARVDVVASASDGVLRWRVEGADGEALRGRRVLLRPDGVALGPVGPDGPGQRCAVTGRGVVAVVDAESGVTAVVEVR